jgi:tRNA A-37 threonylcarbamoyl transferase component Bud32
MNHRHSSPGPLAIDDRQLDEPPAGSACLTTDEILELLLGSMPEAKREVALEHVAGCKECRVLFGSAAEALEDTNPAAAAPRRGVFREGELIANRYCIERFLARGGMGEVYAVRDEVLDEQVALKTLRADPSDDKAIRRLKSEAMLSRRIGHANVCRIFDFGEHAISARETICFLTMELVKGETLGARLRRSGPLPVELVGMVLRQILGGLAEAHALGIMHRDLKSDNIMLREPTAAGMAIDAVVMDFGLALRVDADERLTSDTHALIGSAAYMSPEQVEGQRLTPATDVYALGVILFEMLTGQLPFRAATPVATALQRLHNTAPQPSSLRPELDPYWDRLVLRCLQRAADQRFGSAREVLSVLERPGALHELDSITAVAATLQAPRSRAAGFRVLAIGGGVAAVASLWIMAALPRRPPATSSGRAAPALRVAPAAAAPAVTSADPPPAARGGAPPREQPTLPSPEPELDAPSPVSLPTAPPPVPAAPTPRTETRAAAERREVPVERAGAPPTARDVRTRAAKRAPAPPSPPPEPSPPVGDVSSNEAIAPRETDSPKGAPPAPASPLEPLPLDPEFPE